MVPMSSVGKATGVADAEEVVNALQEIWLLWHKSRGVTHFSFVWDDDHFRIEPAGD